VNVTYDNQTDLQSRRIGNLAVTVPMLEKINLAAIVNRHLPTGVREPEIDYGTVIELLVAARMYRPTPLYSVAEWAAESGADLLYQVDTNKLNDDRIGRALDQFFTARHSILSSVALGIADKFDIPIDKLHYDPTHLYFTGRYDNSEPRDRLAVELDEDGNSVLNSDGDLPAVHITKGKPLGDAPTGSRMIHLGLATHVDEFGAMPMYAHAMDGNENGRTGIGEYLGLVSEYLQPAKMLSISDRGTFSAKHLLQCRQRNMHATCSVPWKELKNLFDQEFEELQWTEASYLSVEQQRRRETNSTLELEHYQTASSMKTFTDSTTKKSIDCRVIFVYSSADAKVTAQQRQKQLKKVEQLLESCQLNVRKRGPFSDPAAVSRRIAKAVSRLSIAKHIAWEMVPYPAAEQPDPLPGRGRRKPTHEFRYTIDREAIAEDTTYDGYSGIVTTLSQAEACEDDVFTDFKQQTYSELANRVLKNPKQMALRPIFLHTPERIEALAFVLMIGLMTHFLIQREYRKHASADPSLDIQPESEDRKQKKRSKEQRRMTTDKIFKLVNHYSIILEIQGDHVLVRPTKPSKEMRLILKRLDIDSPAKLVRRKIELHQRC